MERDGSGVTALLGLGFGVCAQLLDEASGEWWLAVETTSDRGWCEQCGVRATGHGRRHAEPHGRLTLSHQIRPRRPRVSA